MGFFEENAKTANGYQLVHWIPTFFDMKNGGCCKIKIWCSSIYVNKTCLNFFVQLLGGCFSVPKKPSKKHNNMFQLKFPAFRFQVWSGWFRLFLVWISSIPKDQQPYEHTLFSVAMFVFASVIWERCRFKQEGMQQKQCPVAHFGPCMVYIYIYVPAFFVDFYGISRRDLYIYIPYMVSMGWGTNKLRPLNLNTQVQAIYRYYTIGYLGNPGWLSSFARKNDHKTGGFLLEYPDSYYDINLYV